MFLCYCNFLWYSRSFAKAAGCEMTSLKACVKTKSTQEVLDAQSQVFSNPILLPFGPVVDGYFLQGIMCLSQSQVEIIQLYVCHTFIEMMLNPQTDKTHTSTRCGRGGGGLDGSRSWLGISLKFALEDNTTFVGNDVIKR